MEGNVGDAPRRAAAPAPPGRAARSEGYGNYRILDRLGSGGSGVVFRAIDETTGENVALKTLELRDPSDLECLRREIHSLSRLRSEGIVRILHHGISGGAPWYAMELIEGRTIDSLWNHGPTDPGAATVLIDQVRPALRAIRRVCDTLAFLHGEGIVHRDLKPGNVVLRPNGLPVLVDFGFAARFGARISREILDVGGELVGTLAYMSPEQARGELVDARADLYSVGCMLYEAVTGRPPFVGEAWDVFDQQLHAAPAPPSRLAREIPPALEGLILGLLSKDPAERIGYAVDVSVRLAEILQESAEAERQSAAMYLYRPRFAGRQPQIARLDSAIDGLVGGTGGAVFVAGESGVGKTRFAMEAARLATRRGALVIAGQCVSLESSLESSQVQGGPLHPFVPLLRYIGDYCRAQGIAATQRILGRRAKTLAAYEHGLAELPGVEQYPDPSAMQAADARERLVNDLAETLLLFAKEAQLLLMIDDLQWADELTLHVLATLPPTFFRDAPMLLVGCYRSEELGPQLEKAVEPYFDSTIRLDRLEQHDLARLASDMLAMRRPSAPLSRFLGAHTEGNPFFVSEYLRLVVEERQLVRSREGSWQVANAGSDESYEGLPIPRSIYTLVERRLAGVSETGRVLLDVAAVAGREFESELLRDCVELTEADRLEAVANLLSRHILEETTGGGLRFSHDKLREVAYDLLPSASRRHLHEIVAQAVERRYAGPGIPSWYPSLALHWANAMKHEKAAEYYALAGETALRAGASGDARGYYERALASDDDSTVKVERLKRGHWIRQMGDASYGIGDITGTIRYASDAQDHLGFVVPRGAFGQAWSVLRNVPQVLARPATSGPIVDSCAHEAALAAGQVSQVYFLRSSFLAGIDSQLRSVALARRSGGLAMAAQSFAQIGYVGGTVGLTWLSRRCFAQAHALRDDADPNVFGGVLYFQCMYETGRANWPQARRFGEQACELLDRLGNRQEAETALCVLGNVFYNHGDYAGAAELCETLLASARARGNRHHTGWGLFLGGRAIAAQGRLAEALPMLEQGHELLLATNDVLSLIMCEGILARVHLRLGNVTRARELCEVLDERLGAMLVVPLAQCIDGVAGLAEVALALWEREREPGCERLTRRACRRLDLFARMHPFALPSALRCRGQRRWIGGAHARATLLWRRSVTTAERFDMGYEQARAHQLLASHDADSAQRDSHRRAAVSIFTRLGCRYELGQLGDGPGGEPE